VIAFLDACAVIYLVEEISPWASRVSRSLLDLGPPDVVQIAVSELSVMECRVKPLRDADAVALARYQQFFQQQRLRIQPLDSTVLDTAARLRAAHRLKTPDALQAASAIVCGADPVFVTNDARFSDVRGLQVMLL